jgi:hypothetical protein
MEDDWDADDFEIPVLPATSVPMETEEEEDLALKEAAPVKAQPSAAQIAALEKKAQEEEKILAAKAQFLAHENETASQRKLREAKQLEESEAALAGEMLGAGSSKGSAKDGVADLTKGLGSIVLKSKEDHSKYGNITRQKLTGSSAFNIAAFYKSLSKVLDQPSVTAETLDEIINDLTAIRDTKAKAAKQNVVKKVSQKEIKKTVKAIHDKFGGEDYDDKYSHLSTIEDDFM